MKHLLSLISLFFLYQISVHAQSNWSVPNNWAQFNVPGSAVQYKLPHQTFSKDTARIYFNSCEVDSLLGLTVVVIDSLNTNEQPDSLFLGALLSEGGDTLRALVAGIVFLEQATLVELDTGHIGNTKYLDAGFELQGVDPHIFPFCL
jgi:hypothetical protein